MKQRITIIIMLAGLVTMLAGCAEKFNVRKGELVRFTISAKGSPETKTSYSDALYKEGTKTYERIDWVAGDKIRIISSRMGIVHAAYTQAPTERPYYDYTIKTVTTNDRLSRGKLDEPAAGEGLKWVNDPYGVTFYGSYPPVAYTHDGETGDLVSFNSMIIPESQTVKSVKTDDVQSEQSESDQWKRKNMKPYMTNAYMLCVSSEFNKQTDGEGAEVTDEYGQNVPYMNMEFYPVFNAFFIELKSTEVEKGGVPIIVDEVSLTSTDPLSGSFNYNITNGVSDVDGNFVDNESKVTVDLTTNIVASDRTTIPESTTQDEQSVVTTLLTLPPAGSKLNVANTGKVLTNVTLHVSYHLEGQAAKANIAKLYLKKGDNWLQFPAFQKSRILGLRMSSGQWKIFISPVDVDEWTELDGGTVVI